MRLHIVYTTRFRYAKPVTESQNELRACPAGDERQQLLHYHVTTRPSSRVASYVDYWGTRVDTFGIRAAHDELEVTAQATVDTSPQPDPPAWMSRGALDDPRFRDDRLALLQRSAHVDWGGEVAGAAQEVGRAAGDDLLALLWGVHDRVAELDYRSGTTEVGVAVDKVFVAGAGVCQDFAHLALAMYRELGVPARYVSGYLFTADDATGADVEVDEVRVQTHAWVEAAIPGWGWLALDPTNRQPVGERHVAIGRGRDYDDVAPLRGVFIGNGDHELSVDVRMRRLAAEPLEGMPGSGRRHLAEQRQQQA